MTTKQAACRSRYHGILKTTVDKAEKLTGNAEYSSIAIYREELETDWSNYSSAFNLHEDTLIGRDENALTSINAEFTAMHNTYISAKLHLGKLAAAVQGANVLNSTLLDTSNIDGTKTVKLPPVKLSVFSGELKEWTEFKATCRSILTDKILDVQRLQYLKEALTGEPRELVAHILPAEGAYERAMKLLVGRYENVRANVNGHLHRLYTIERDTATGEATATLRKVINTINGLKAALKGVDIETDTWDSILIFNTSQCLHPNSRKAWEEKLEGKRVIPTLESYLNFLEASINILENTVSFTTLVNHHKQPMIVKREFKAKAFYTLKAEFKCLICKKNHLSQRCDELYRMSASERRAAVHKSGVCFNCCS